MQPSAPPPATGPGQFGPSEMEGAQPAVAAAQPQVDAAALQQQTLQSAVQQIRQIDLSISALAEQFPACSRDARQAQDAVRSMLKRIIATPTQQVEPVGPRVLG